jgi:hypothetical protein
MQKRPFAEKLTGRWLRNVLLFLDVFLSDGAAGPPLEKGFGRRVFQEIIRGFMVRPF